MHADLASDDANDDLAGQHHADGCCDPTVDYSSADTGGAGYVDPGSGGLTAGGDIAVDAPIEPAPDTGPRL